MKQTNSDLFTGDKIIDRNKLRALMEIHGLRQEDIAEELGVSEAYVSQFIHRKKKFPRAIEYFEKLAEDQDVIIQKAYRTAQ